MVMKSVLLDLATQCLKQVYGLLLPNTSPPICPHLHMGNYLPAAVASCWNGYVLNAGLWKVLTFHIRTIETFRSWKSKGPFDLRIPEGCAQQRPWREANVSGSVKEILVCFVPLGLVTTLINTKTQLQKDFAVRTKCIATCVNCRWACCAGHEVFLLISVSGPVVKRWARAFSNAGWAVAGDWSVVDSEKVWAEKGKEACFHQVVLTVLRGVAGEQWRGLGRKEMTWYIDLIWPTLETNHVPKRQVPRCSLRASLQEWKMDNLK